MELVIDRQIIVGARTIASISERINSKILAERLERVIIERGFGHEAPVSQKPKTTPQNKAERPKGDKSIIRANPDAPQAE